MFELIAKCNKCGAQSPCQEAGKLPKSDLATGSGWYWFKDANGDERLACSHTCLLAIVTDEHERQSKRLAKIQEGRMDNISRFKRAVKSSLG